MADFPTVITNVVAGVTEIQAKHINNIEAKVGIDGSAVVTSLDYLLKNAASINPGHGHTLAALTDVTALPAELNLLDLAGLTAGHVLRATGAAAAAWGAIQAGDLPTIPVDGGGTGLVTVAAGDLLYASAADTLAALAKVASGNVLLSGDLPSWGKVGLTTHVNGILGSANGGTGNGFTAFTGPTTAEKTFTLPDASAILLYDGGALGTPASGTLTNCTFPILNQDTTGSAGSLKSPVTTGLMTVTGMTAGVTRGKTVRDADDTFLELGGSYIPTGTWNWTSATVTWPIFNQNTTGSSASCTGNAASATFWGSYAGIAGPTQTRTYTFPDATCTVLTTNASVTVSQGGTGLSSLAQGDLLYASAADTLAALAKSVTTGHYLKNSGTDNNPAWGSIAADELPTAIDAAKIANGSVSNAEYQYLGNVTSDIQGQINAKAPIASPTFTGNVGVGVSTFGTSANKVLGLLNGTAPTTSPADTVQVWAADRSGVAGKAGIHVRAEDGTVHVLGDYVGIATSSPAYPLDVTGLARFTNCNIGIGTTPMTYNATGSEYFCRMERTLADATASSTKRSLSIITYVNPSAEAAIYYQGLHSSYDIQNTCMYNLNGYVRALGSIVYHRANTTLARAEGLYVYVGTYNGGSDSTGIITNLYGAKIEGTKTASSTITNAYGMHISGIQGTNAYDIYAAGSANKNYFAGCVGIGAVNFGTSATQTMAIQNGTAPSSSPANLFQLYSADQAAGNACPHFRTENGAIIKLFQGAALTAALTTLTYTAPGTPDYAVQDLTNSGGYGFVTKDEGNTVLSVIANLQARVNELEGRFQAHGLIA